MVTLVIVVLHEGLYGLSEFRGHFVWDVVYFPFERLLISLHFTKPL